jgi:hypothetical protein
LSSADAGTTWGKISTTVRKIITKNNLVVAIQLKPFFPFIVFSFLFAIDTCHFSHSLPVFASILLPPLALKAFKKTLSGKSLSLGKVIFSVYT